MEESNVTLAFGLVAFVVVVGILYLHHRLVYSKLPKRPSCRL